MEKSSGIWTQRMYLRLESNWLVIIDYENGVSRSIKCRYLISFINHIFLPCTGYCGTISIRSRNGFNQFHHPRFKGALQQHSPLYRQRRSSIERNEYFGDAHISLPSNIRSKDCRRRSFAHKDNGNEGWCRNALAVSLCWFLNFNFELIGMYTGQRNSINGND
jgi:hypothetical protein